MSSPVAITNHPRPCRVTRIGSVSYLNAKPLIYGLDETDDLRLTLDVPSRLIDGLRDRRFDVALLPVIDYQRFPGLRLLTAGGIGCDGPTLTVRIFSKVPIEQIRVLACDTDSHTSVALARIVLAETINLTPEFTELRHDEPAARLNAQAMLLIGDKVVCEEPAGYPYQLDLGEGWKRLTHLPFVFAAWMAREDVDLTDLPHRLTAAKQSGLTHVHEIVKKHATPRGWPPALALQYMTAYLKYDIAEPQLNAIRLFHRKAAEHGIITGEVRELLL